MMRNKSRFGLLYNQLWLVDNLRLKRINPEAEAEHWLNLSNDRVENMREKVAILISDQDAIVKEEVIKKIEGGKKNTPAILQDVNLGMQSISLDKKPIMNGNLLLDWVSLVKDIEDCTKCSLCSGRRNVVIERGSRHAKWMFIGEAPGENEDIQGRPFVGTSGDLLNKMIAAMNLDAVNDVYICNVVKCRPPHNRNPEKDEILLCNNYLMSQIALVKPKIIVTLGRFASQTLLQKDIAVNKLRRQVHRFNNIPLIVTFHPSYLLRNPEAKKDAWVDLQLAMKVFKDDANKD